MLFLEMVLVRKISVHRDSICKNVREGVLVPAVGWEYVLTRVGLSFDSVSVVQSGSRFEVTKRTRDETLVS